MRKISDCCDYIVWSDGDGGVGFHRTGVTDHLPEGGVLVRLVAKSRHPRLNRMQVRRLRDWLTEVLDDE